MNKTKMRLKRALQAQKVADYSEQIKKIVFLAQYQKIENPRYISFWQIFRALFRSIFLKTWLYQSLAFCILAILLWNLLNFHSLSLGGIVKLLSRLSVFAAFFVLPFLYRSVRYRMLEVESAAWISGRRLILIRTGVVLFGNFIALAGICTMIVLRTQIGLWLAAGSTAFPFLLIVYGLLFLLRKSDIHHFMKPYLILCFVSAVLLPHLFQFLINTAGAYFSFYMIALSALFMILNIYQFRRLFQTGDNTIYA